MKVFLETFGRCNADFMGKKRLDLLHPEDLQMVSGKANEILDRGGARFEVRIKKIDGNYLWVEMNAKMFYDYLNEKKILVVGRDITERKKSEQNLRESEEKYRSITENSLMGIAIVQDNKIEFYVEIYPLGTTF